MAKEAEAVQVAIGPKSIAAAPVATQGIVPVMGRFHYSRAELIADGVVHAVGIVLAISGGAALLGLSAFRTGPWEYVAAVFYVVSLLTVLTVSAIYNMCPICPAKWILRRFDHAAIYLLIAGTYTPFLAQMNDAGMARLMMGVIWAAAALGMAVKLFMPGRFDRVAIGFYLAMGWSGVVIFRELSFDLSPTTLWLILAGGVIYTLGVVFFIWHRLRFQTAIWHGFVVVGAALHMSALMSVLLIAGS